jgi:predicted enzyme related to lactoylglutathione lyase
MDLLVNIDVDDLPRAIDFYTRAFDLKIGRRFGDDGAELLGASAPIYLLRKAAGTPASKTTDDTRRYTRHWTPVHLDFATDDIEAALARAAAAGATVESKIHSPRWGRIVMLSDPFGHGICLLQFTGRGYDEIAT